MSDKVQKAFDVLRKAMSEDNPSEPGSLAHSWHCNIAMMCYDAMHETQAQRLDESSHDWRHKVANDSASRFMKLCFDVETKA